MCTTVHDKQSRVVHVGPNRAGRPEHTAGVWCSQAQIFSHKHGQDFCQVQHGGAMHVLLGVIECVPELWEGGADEV